MKNVPTISALQKRLRTQMEQAEWIVTDHESFHAAVHAKRKLGSLPKRLLKTQVEFDPYEDRTYGHIPGGMMAGLAARVVLASKGENKLLNTLRGIVTGLIAPFIAYLRVNLALTKLEEAYRLYGHGEPSESLSPDDRPIAQNPTVPTRRPTFKWRQSPKDVYGFEKAKAEQGFDPRETSVYWIETRAARLRQKWKRQAATGNNFTPQSRHPGLRAGGSAHGGDISYGSLSLEIPDNSYGISGMTEGEEGVPVRDFVPVEADYGTIWPPIELPKELPNSAGGVTSKNKTTQPRHPGLRAGASNSGSDIGDGSPSLEVPDKCSEPLPWPSSRIFDPQDQIFAVQPSSKSRMTKRKGVGEANVDHGFHTVEFADPCDLQANTEFGMMEIEGARKVDVVQADMRPGRRNDRNPAALKRRAPPRAPP